MCRSQEKKFKRFVIAKVQGVSKNPCWQYILSETKMATSIDNLPNEILAIIFRGLSLKDIGHCSQTCVRWEQIIASLYKNKG